MGAQHSNNILFNYTISKKSKELTEEESKKMEEEMDKYWEKKNRESKEELEKYIKNNPLAYFILQKMPRLEENKNFSIEIPIQKILDVPVIVSLKYTCKEGNIQIVVYDVDLIVTMKNTKKILYEERCYSYLRYHNEKFDANYKKLSSLSNQKIINTNIIMKTMNNILHNLKKDTYMECFVYSKEDIPDYDNLSPNFQDIPGIEFKKIYKCRMCGGKTETDNICYFCYHCK